MNHLDYRMLPIHQLNSNIPKGRKMIKWAPFATMPELFKSLKHTQYEQTKKPRPILTDDRLNIINQQLDEATRTTSYIALQYYHDGFIHYTEMYIESIDRFAEFIIGRQFNHDEASFVPFIDVVSVDVLPIPD
jgi:hypothetical protein